MGKKKHQKKVKEGFRDIFKAHIENSQKNYQDTSFDDIGIIVKEPIVKHQIIQLAKLCEEVPFNLTLKSSGNGVSIEFWQAINVY